MCAFAACELCGAEDVWRFPENECFGVDFAAGYAAGEHILPSDEPAKNASKHVLTDVCRNLDGKIGNWTAVVADGAPFSGRYMRVESPAGGMLAGRFEIFRVPDGRRDGVWFVEFDYADMTGNAGGAPEELFRAEVKNMWGKIVCAPVVGRGGISCGSDPAVRTPLESGKVHRVRIEAEFGGERRCAVSVNGREVYEGAAPDANEFGGASFVMVPGKSDVRRVFGIGSIRSGRVAGARWDERHTADADGYKSRQERLPFAYRAESCSGLDDNGIPAASAAEFLDSMGINVNVFDDERHSRIVLPRLKELGIRHIRTGLRTASLKDYRGDGAIMLRNIKELGSEGFMITGIWNCWHSMNDFVGICDYLLPEGLYQAEGPNEPWHVNESFKWRGEKWPIGPVLYMRDMWKTLKSSGKTVDIPIVGFSGTTSGYGSIERWVDCGCEHIYTDGGEALSDNNALSNKIERCRSTNYPSKPIQITETGYNSGGKDSGIRPTSEWMQARGVPRLYLEGFRHGVERTFVYALLARDDKGFSLLNADGSAKPAFNAVRDFIRILAPEGSGTIQSSADGNASEPRNADIPGDVTAPNPIVNMSVSCAVPTVHHLLLRRADGRFVLCLWNDVDGFDEKSGRDIENSRAEAVVCFDDEAGELQLFEPCLSGIKCIGTLKPIDGKVLINVPDHPVMAVFDAKPHAARTRREGHPF